LNGLSQHVSFESDLHGVSCVVDRFFGSYRRGPLRPQLCVRVTSKRRDVYYFFFIVTAVDSVDERRPGWSAGVSAEASDVDNLELHG